MLPVRLMILPFLQRWDGTSLSLRLLTTPQGSPLDPLAAGEPAFVDAAFTFELRLVADPGLVPTLSTAATAISLATPPPAQARTLCETLRAGLPIDETIPTVDARTTSARFMKYAPPGYRDATGYRGGTNPFLLTDDSYHCAIKAPVPSGTQIKSDPPKLPWGKVIAQALRQPQLAAALGLVRELTITPTADFFEDGGWIYAALAAGTPGAALFATPGAIKVYAARVPPLSTARSLFTPVLFPVAASVPPGVSYDTLFRESVEYDDGFAKAVYVRQPHLADPLAEEEDGDRPVNDQGVQLGWDDEQVVTWFNRQIDPTAGTQDAPMGVLGYRVDAKRPGDAQWSSLVLGETSLQIGDTSFPSAQSEFRVEIAPNKLFGDTGPNYWVPSYYTAWTGPSLAAQDEIAAQLRGLPPTTNELIRGVAPGVPLRYGEEYEFRVRLTDLAGGGPDPMAERRNPAPQPAAPLRFLRWVKPGAVRLRTTPPVVAVPDAPPASLEIRRPLLAIPRSCSREVLPPTSSRTCPLPMANSVRPHCPIPMWIGSRSKCRSRVPARPRVTASSRSTPLRARSPGPSGIRCNSISHGTTFPTREHCPRMPSVRWRCRLRVACDSCCALSLRIVPITTEPMTSATVPRPSSRCAATPTTSAVCSFRPPLRPWKASICSPALRPRRNCSSPRK